MPGGHTNLESLLMQAAERGCEPSVCQRMDKRWQASVHDPRDMDRDADHAIGNTPVEALERALKRLDARTDEDVSK